MHSAKFNAYAIAAICKARGIYHMIFSPGSRNAPFVIEFGNDDSFHCCTIPDERVAGFYALGQGIYTGRPSIVCCTSGTALLNYAPAVAEAYYQGIPMIILSADRPKEMIDMGIGQSINQSGVFNNYCKISVDLIQEPSSAEQKTNEKLINQALDVMLNGKPGPVHINVPFHEPLYDKVKAYNWRPTINPIDHKIDDLNEELTAHLSSVLKKSRKIMILAGQYNNPDEKTEELLINISDSKAAVILTEMTTNYKLEKAIVNIDRTLEIINEVSAFQPDLLITIGGAVISKRIKKFLQNSAIKEHWDINPHQGRDTFHSLTHHLSQNEDQILELIKLHGHSEAYFDEWNNLNELSINRHSDNEHDIEYSDFSIFSTILKKLNTPTVLHLANSTPIRYVQLFPRKGNVKYLSNRGVSGIDGCTSTAIGYASLSEKLNVLVTGDIGFFYDSNAFWMKNLPSNLKIILINNGGGGIFRIIDGPTSTEQLEEVFESHHNTRAEHLAKMYDLEYQSAQDTESFQFALDRLLESESISLLEVFTPREKNADILKSYFRSMRNEA